MGERESPYFQARTRYVVNLKILSVVRIVWSQTIGSIVGNELEAVWKGAV